MANTPPVIYLTGKDNFREKIAITAPYKGNRADMRKPWHYANLTGYLIVKYDAIVVDGMEADDAMCIEQFRTLETLSGIPYHYPETIICTRDKDLRQCPGWHFGWELGNQPQFGPEFVEGFGYLKLDEKKKLTGVGDKFFYAQLLMGDRVDNIPGIPGYGPVAAFKILDGTSTKEEAEKAVVEVYKEKFPDTWKEYLLEQGQLLWMVRELDEDGKPVMWGIE